MAQRDMGMQLCVLVVAVSILGGINCEVSCLSGGSSSFPSITITDVSTSQEIKDCILAVNQEDVSKLEIISPFLTVLETGVFSDLRLRNLTIMAENLVRIEDNMFSVKYCTTQHIIIMSNELVELNENQFQKCTNLMWFHIYGTKVTSMSFAWSQGTDLREVHVRNAYELENIDRSLSRCMFSYGPYSYIFENTGIKELPLYMFDEYACGNPTGLFKGNRNLKVIRAFVFHRSWPGGVKATFIDTPIEVIEPNFMKVDENQITTALVLGGNRLGKIDQDTFKPILEHWSRMDLNPDGTDQYETGTYIKWDVDGERTSLPIKCDCSLKWIFSNENMTRYIKNAVCENGTPLEELTKLEFENCFECPAESGLYPDLEDCHNFYQCSSYTPYLKYCPDGLVFNPARSACDWAYNTAPPCGTATAA